MDWALSGVGRLALGRRDREARDCDCLASKGVSYVLDLESPARQARAPGLSLEIRALIRHMSRENPGWEHRAFTANC